MSNLMKKLFGFLYILIFILLYFISYMRYTFFYIDSPWTYYYLQYYNIANSFITTAIFLIFAIPFIFGYVFKKKRLIIIIFSTIAFLLLINYSYTLANTAKDYFLDFTPEKWLKYPKIQYVMVDGLEKSHYLIGMDEDKAKQFLNIKEPPNNNVYTVYIGTVDSIRKYTLSALYIKVKEGKVVDVNLLHLH